MRRSKRETWILVDDNGLKQWDLAAKRYDDAVEEALNSLGYEVIDEKDKKMPRVDFKGTLALK